MKRIEWYIARRYLASRRKGNLVSLSAAIAIGGIFLGVTALITVIAVMTGLQRELQDKILGSNPHVYIFEYGESFRMNYWRDAMARIGEVPGVVAAQPFVMTQVGIMKGDYAQFGTLFGIDPESWPEPLTTIDEQIRAGELSFGPTQSGLPGIILGNLLAERLSVLPGHVVRIATFENVRQTPHSAMPIIPQADFEVTGIFNTGMYDYDSENMYAQMAPLQDLLDLDDQVSGIGVNVTDPWRADRIGDAIVETLGYPNYARDWMTQHRSLFSALKLEKLAMAIILFLIVVVAAFNIVSTLIMVVRDKTREIGILKSMGLTDRKVLRIFMLQGLAIGLIGTALGGPAGVFLIWLQSRYELIKLAPDIYFVEALPVALSLGDVLLIVVMSILIAFAATIYPAYQASRLMPVEAIRHE